MNLSLNVNSDGVYDLEVMGRFSTTYIYIKDADREKFASAKVKVFECTVDDTKLKSEGSIIIEHGFSANVSIEFGSVTAQFLLTFANS